jgi:hypothetical protein
MHALSVSTIFFVSGQELCHATSEKMKKKILKKVQQVNPPLPHPLSFHPL